MWQIISSSNVKTAFSQTKVLQQVEKFFGKQVILLFLSDFEQTRSGFLTTQYSPKMSEFQSSCRKEILKKKQFSLEGFLLKMNIARTFFQTVRKFLLFSSKSYILSPKRRFLLKISFCETKLRSRNKSDSYRNLNEVPVKSLAVL